MRYGPLCANQLKAWVRRDQARVYGAGLRQVQVRELSQCEFLWFCVSPAIMPLSAEEKRKRRADRAAKEGRVNFKPRGPRAQPAPAPAPNPAPAPEAPSDRELRKCYIKRNLQVLHKCPNCELCYGTLCPTHEEEAKRVRRE